MPPRRSCASQTELAFSLGRSPSTRSRTLSCSHTALRIDPVMASTPAIQVLMGSNSPQLSLVQRRKFMWKYGASKWSGVNEIRTFERSEKNVQLWRRWCRWANLDTTKQRIIRPIYIPRFTETARVDLNFQISTKKYNSSSNAACRKIYCCCL